MSQSLNIQPKKPSTSSAGTNKTVGMRTSEMSYMCTACGRPGCFFHDFGTRLSNAKSAEEFKTHIAALIRNIWIAPSSFWPCVVKAVHECLEACKRTTLPVGPSVQFYYFQLEAIRDELCSSSACATTGFNNLKFSRARLASLRHWFETCSHATRMEIGRGLRLHSGPAERVTVIPTESGFKLKWFVPDMLQKLHSGTDVGIEFVSKDQAWTMCIQPQGGQEQWGFKLYALKPRQNSFNETGIFTLRVSRHKERKIFNRGSMIILLDLPCIPASYIAVEGGVAQTQTNYSWIFPSFTVYNSHECINEGGSCYLTLTTLSLMKS